MNDRDDTHLRFGRCLVIACVIYHLPDYPHVLGEFVWQTLDMPPTFPRIFRFLEHWEKEIEGPLHSVNIACAGETFQSGFIRTYDEITFH